MSIIKHGHGVCTDDAKIRNIESVKALVATAPKLQTRLANDIADIEAETNDINEFIDELAGCLADDTAGIATILAVVIKEREGIRLLATTDSACFCYLILPNRNPWDYNALEKDLTEQKLNQIISNYLRMVTDTDLTINEKTIEWD